MTSMRDAVAASIRLDARLTTPVYRQIYERVRHGILSGSLPPGTRLPSWNGLAGSLGIARGTVKAAYDWLAGEGYVVGRGAAGTIVNPELARRPSRPVTPRRSAAKAGGARWQPPVSAPPDGARTGPSWAKPPLPFQMGVPALDVFPRALWTRLLARRARGLAADTMVYQDPAGHAPLRHAIANYLAVARGIACTVDQVFITAGYTGALDLVSRTLLRPGDAVCLEDPGYPRTREGLRLAGARIVPVPVDDEGLIVARAMARARDARFIVVTPSHQAPLGMRLSLPRRLALLEWAARQRSWIVEDDYYSEFRLEGRPAPALKSLDAAGRVLYVGTFSKVLLPSLRLGYVVVPAAAADGFTRVASYLAPSQSLLMQMAVADFMTQGHFARHIRRMRGIYAERRAALVAALEGEFAGGVTIGLQDSGMHLLARLPAGTDDMLTERRAQAAGLAPVALSPWAIEADCGPGLLMNFANIAPHTAPREARRLHQALRLPSRRR